MNALEIACPRCGAAVGQPCGRRTHARRVHAALAMTQREEKEYPSATLFSEGGKLSCTRHGLTSIIRCPLCQQRRCVKCQPTCLGEHRRLPRWYKWFREEPLIPYRVTEPYRSTGFGGPHKYRPRKKRRSN